jgi:hypothetical protein
VKLWLDDVRPAPEGWYGVKSVEEAKAAFMTYPISEASLDHDLGYVADPNWDGDPREPQEIAIDPNVSRPGADGIDLVRWMCEFGMYPSQGITIHSWNPVGASNMAALLLGNGCPCPVAIDPFRVS